MLTSLTKNWWTFLLRGVIAIVFGALALIWPEQAKLALVLLFGAYVLVDGMFSVFAGIATYQFFNRWWAMVIPGEWALILSGLLSILFGGLLIAFPGAGVVSVVWIIGIYAIFFGVLMAVFAFRLRGLRRDLETTFEAIP